MVSDEKFHEALDYLGVKESDNRDEGILILALKVKELEARIRKHEIVADLVAAIISKP